MAWDHHFWQRFALCSPLLWVKSSLCRRGGAWGMVSLACFEALAPCEASKCLNRSQQNLWSESNANSRKGLTFGQLFSYMMRKRLHTFRRLRHTPPAHHCLDKPNCLKGIWCRWRSFERLHRPDLSCKLVRYHCAIMPWSLEARSSWLPWLNCREQACFQLPVCQHTANSCRNLFSANLHSMTGRLKIQRTISTCLHMSWTPTHTQCYFV